MTATIVNTKTIENGLVAVYSALVLQTREDGSNYRIVSELHPDYLVVKEIIYDLHDGELSNDWRYQIIYDLAQNLLEYSEGQPEPWGMDEFMEAIPEVSRSLTVANTKELLEWAKIGHRLYFEDGWFDPSTAEPLDIGELLQRRQREEIESTAYGLLRLVEELLT